MTMRQAQDPREDDEDADSGGLDAELIKSYLSFAARAIKKRLRLVLTVFVGVLTLVIVVLAVWPRTYYCETRLTAQSAGALSGQDDRNDPGRSLDGAVANLMRYENLHAIVKQTDLVRRWNESRAPLQKLKDWGMKQLVGEPSDKDKAEVLVATLQTKLTVDASGGILTIGAVWPEPQMAARLVEAARQNFLEMRHINEISMLAENISILEGHVGRVRNEIYEIAENVKDLRQEKRLKAEQAVAKANQQAGAEGGALNSSKSLRAALPPPTLAVDEELASMKVLLEAKQQALKEIEAERARSLRELQGRLRELKLTYTEVHPQVVHVKTSIESLSRDSPQTAALRSEVEDLKARIRDRARLEGRGGFAVGGRATANFSAETQKLPPELMSLVRDSAGDIDPTVTTQFELAVRRFSDLQDRISGARIELDRAQAAFKHRYKLMTPAEVPNKPVKPKVSLVLLGGVAGSILLALIVALLAELRTGRIVERWQVKQLDLPILGELRLPPGPNR